MSDETERIALDPADYWQLRARIKEVEAANAAVDQAQRRAAAASAAHNAHAKALAAKYPGLVLDNAAWRTDDETCSLVKQE